jgi:hypothetical protein
MPFDKRGITDDEAVTIVDFIRGHCEAEPRTWFWLRFDCARPIVLICREGADIWVHNGELEGPVSGGGDVVILRIDDGECTIQGFGGWVS